MCFVTAALMASLPEAATAEDFFTAGSVSEAEEETVHTHSVILECGNASILKGDFLASGLTTDRHGVLTVAPQSKNQLYNRACYDYEFSFDKWRLEAGGDIYLYYAGCEKLIDRWFHLQQLFVKSSWGKYSATLGCKEENGEFVPKLSSGNMLWSGNARPAPTLSFRTDDFVSTFFTAHILQLKGNISWSKHIDGGLNRAIYKEYEGIYAKKGFESHYYDNITDNRQHAKVENPWFHRKSLFIRTSPEYPVFATYGFEHGVMYGGKVNDENCSGGVNWLRAILGGSGKQPGNQFNHAMVQNYRLDWRHNIIHIGLYKQHYADDMEGGLFSNGADGLWGMEILLPKSRWIKNIVVEYVQSTNQGGVVYANDEYTKLDDGYHVYRTAGNSNFYHDQHMGAWTHYGMMLGNPLFASPLYNADFYPDMASNMLRAYHFTVSGQLMYRLDYAIRIQHIDSWGTPFAPFGEIRSCTSYTLEASYPFNDRWRVNGGIAIEKGKLYGDNSGFQLNIQYCL